MCACVHACVLCKHSMHGVITHHIYRVKIIIVTVPIHVDVHVHSAQSVLHGWVGMVMSALGFGGIQSVPGCHGDQTHANIQHTVHNFHLLMDKSPQ